MGGNEIIAIRSDPYAGEMVWSVRMCVCVCSLGRHRAVLLHLLHIVAGGDGIRLRSHQADSVIITNIIF